MLKSLTFITSACLLFAVLLTARPAATAYSIAPLPERLGKIVFQTQRNAAAKVFIIVNSHRSAQSGDNGRNTLQAQIETYRIGEWLIKHKQIELLLPEGFFGERQQVAAEAGHLLDGTELSARLADTTRFVNAELLLRERFGIGMQQVEDRQLYRYIRDQLRNRLSDNFTQQLQDLQRRRTAVIMQNIPSTLETTYRQGDISVPTAMLTIGLSHLDDLIFFLESGQIRIDAHPPFPALESELELQKRNIDVTVIVPHSLLGLMSAKRLAIN